jgi:hypothetical protein
MMGGAATKPAAESTELNATKYNAFTAGLELAEIELVKIHGERAASGLATQTRFDLTASYLQDETTIHYRYDVTAHLTNDAGTSLGYVAASVVVTARATVEGDTTCIEQFGGTSGALMAYPYLREAIASTAQRIGFPGVLLSMSTYESDEADVTAKDAVEFPDTSNGTQVGATAED